MTADEVAAELAAKGHYIGPDRRCCEATAAYFLGVSVRTLQRWIREGSAPPYRMVGQRWYRIDDLLEYERPERVD